MKTTVYLSAVASVMLLGFTSCTYHEHEHKPATPTVTTQTTSSEVVRPVVGPTTSTTIRETRSY